MIELPLYKFTKRLSMKKIISPLILLSAALIWGFAFVAQKAAIAIPPLALGALRGYIAALFLIFIILIFDKFTKSDRRLFNKRSSGKPVIDINKYELIGGIICGSFLGVASMLQQIGIKETDAGKTAFITALYVVIVPVYSLFFGKRAPLNAWVSVGIAVAGFYLLCIKNGFSIEKSDFIVLLCAFVFAMQILAIDKFLPKCDCIRLSFIQFLTSATISLIISLIIGEEVSLSAVTDNVLPLLYLGIGSSGIAYTCQIIGQKNTEPTMASIILSLESVFGVLASAVILGEKMLPREYIGCAVVFVAVILSQLDFSAFGKRKKLQ